MKAGWNHNQLGWEFVETRGRGHENQLETKPFLAEMRAYWHYQRRLVNGRHDVASQLLELTP